MKRMLLLVSFVLVATLGCDQHDRTTTVNPDRSVAPPPPATSPTAPEGETPTSELPTMSDSDHALAQRVEQALREDTTLATAAHHIQVHVSEGQVTLRGSVSSQQEKRDLESKAQQVTGVTQVNNQLTIASASR